MDYVAVKDDAQRRIASARVRQLAFEIQSGRELSDADAEMLASVLLSISDGGDPITPEAVKDGLLRRNRSPAAADRILRVIGF